MGLSLAGPSGVGLGLRALRWWACVDPVTDASGFPYDPSFDGGLGRCTGAVSCGRQHLALRVGGRHARVPCGFACARPSWPGRAGRPPGRVLVRLTFSSGPSVFLLCSAPSRLVLPLSWSFVGPPLAFPPLPPPLFFSPPRAPLCSLLSLVSGPGCLGPWRFVFLPPPRPVVFFFAPPRSLAFSRFRPRLPWALALCAVCFVCLPPLGSPCSLASFVFPPRPLVAPWWLLPPPPPLSCLAVFVAVFRCSFFFPLCAPIVSGFRPFPASGDLGLGAVGFSFVGLPLLCSPCALASFVCPSSPLAALWWLLPPPPSPFWRAVFVARCSAFCLFFFSLFRSLVVSAPAVSGFLWFPAPGALGLGAVCFLFWWPPTARLAVRSRLFCVSCLALGCSLVVPVPPPPSVSRGFRRDLPVPGFFFFSFFFVRPRVSNFLWFPALVALGLGAVCCLFCWPPASRLAVPSRLFCVSCLAVGCSLGVAPPPPPPLLCLAIFVAASRCSVFFFVLRLRCLRLFLVSGPGCPGPWRCVLFVSRAAGCGAPCFASSGVVSRGAAVCGVFCALPGVVWRACVWLGSCAVLRWVLLCCFCCALLLCVAAFSAGLVFVVPCLSVQQNSKLAQ